jgi:hypothetical protein
MMKELLIFVASLDKIFFYAFLMSFVMLFATMFIHSYQTRWSYNSNVMGITYLEWCMAGWIAAVTALWTCLLIVLLIGLLI